MGASVNSIVTEQPYMNNNNIPLRVPVARNYTEMPIHAEKLYEVFSKSLIFRDEHELKSRDSYETLEDLETKSEPDYLSDKPNRSRVYFEDEVNSPVTDFEIMFKDELTKEFDISKIEEEKENDKGSPGSEEGLTMNVAVMKQDVIKPSTVTIKDENKITSPRSIYTYDPISIVTLPSSLTIPRAENVKGILRQKGNLSRSLSAKTLERVDSGNKLYKQALNRVESMKNIDPTKINKVLQRVPQRSASFLNIPEHLNNVKPILTKSKSSIGVISLVDAENRLSSLPDTPIIKSVNLPRFFEDNPSLPEYRGETSLQSIKQKTDQMLKDNDFSMPRYYGTLSKSTENIAVHESKSMPDLRNPPSTGKVSKRLVKLRTKLKPLVIKGADEKL